MKCFALCLFGMIITNIFAEEIDFMYKNIEYYEKKPFLIQYKDEIKIDSSMEEKYSITDSGWIEKYGDNKEIEVLYLRANIINGDLYQRQNLQNVIPKYVKGVYNNEILYITLFEPINKPYIYKVVKGFLYITKEPCEIANSIYSFSADYNTVFYITYDEMLDSDAENGLLTQHINGSANYILPIEYDKVEAIYPNIKEQLQNKSYIIIPIKIQIKTFASIGNTIPIDIITISTIAKPNAQETKEILKHYKDTCINYIEPYIPAFCSSKLE